MLYYTILIQDFGFGFIIWSLRFVETFQYFIDADPSGNQKYLMWMVKMYDTDSGFSPNMLQDLVQRFHNNLDKIHPALAMAMGFYSNSKVATSPKNIDSYPDYRTLKRIVDAAEESVTRKQREKKTTSSMMMGSVSVS